MAGDWIKMRGNLWDDPRVAALCDATDQSEATVIGALYWLWATADQHTEDGCMPGLTLRQIDRKTGVPGFAATLVSLGWLADDPQGVVILGFEQHNGSSAKRRAVEAQRKANSRSVSACDADTTRTNAGHDADEKRRIAELEKEREKEVEKNPPTPRKRGEDLSEGFAAFWSAYPSTPRKAAKRQCWDKWRRRGLEARWPRIVAHVKAMAASEAWRKGGGEFIPAPLVYLNQDRFDASTTSEVEVVDWRESRAGIESRGEALGLGRWDQGAFDNGRGEPFQAYRRRVLAAAECHA